MSASPQHMKYMKGDTDATALNQLQSKAQVELLDAVDKLRDAGFHGEIDLPQLIVCGDTSVGKSSCLEAISRVRFPASDGLCTRFAPELVLRRAQKERFSVSIMPAKDRKPEQQQLLEDFKPSIETTKIDRLSDVIKEAGQLLTQVDPQCRIFNDRLKIEISGPTQPHLTLVDLPGIIHAQTHDITAEDIRRVEELMNSYMKNEKSIILAVISAEKDVANQVVLNRAKVFDPSGDRTLGIITKPDRLYQGSEQETQYLGLASNRNVVFGLGWHVLMNQSPKNKHAPADERDNEEQKFFKDPTNRWSRLRNDQLGIETLRQKLRRILLDSIRESLPTLSSDIASRIEVCRNALKDLGQPRSSIGEHQAYLVGLSTKLYELVSAALQGRYYDDFSNFFLESHLGDFRRLRSALRDSTSNFAERMHTKGARVEIDLVRMITNHECLTPGSSPLPPTKSGHAQAMNDEGLMQYIRSMVDKSKGRELPGGFSSEMVGEIFRLQSKSWNDVI